MSLFKVLQVVQQTNLSFATLQESTIDFLIIAIFFMVQKIGFIQDFFTSKFVVFANERQMLNRKSHKSFHSWIAIMVAIAKVVSTILIWTDFAFSITTENVQACSTFFERSHSRSWPTLDCKLIVRKLYLWRIYYVLLKTLLLNVRVNILLIIEGCSMLE